MCGSLFVVEQNCNKQTDEVGEDNSQSAESEPQQKKTRLMLTCNDSESESEDDLTMCAMDPEKSGVTRFSALVECYCLSFSKIGIFCS